MRRRRVVRRRGERELVDERRPHGGRDAGTLEHAHEHGAGLGGQAQVAPLVVGGRYGLALDDRLERHVGAIGPAG